ncbi:hypothetical protein M501DRAFT_1032905 [Patellaria atrata CBS 101060]|uniref:Uncharacterized protein n=1 Tax=Patellaria atrata CBS 101060 TaxID=1346257 RepID=A0A9P4S8S5_9PEZI|nr:hypothetical protein M501DRAFT_1032905 [Patellaria atrata CBS 101060]
MNDARLTFPPNKWSLFLPALDPDKDTSEQNIQARKAWDAQVRCEEKKETPRAWRIILYDPLKRKFSENPISTDDTIHNEFTKLKERADYLEQERSFTGMLVDQLAREAGSAYEEMFEIEEEFMEATDRWKYTVDGYERNLERANRTIQLLQALLKVADEKGINQK